MAGISLQKTRGAGRRLTTPREFREFQEVVKMRNANADSSTLGTHFWGFWGIVVLTVLPYSLKRLARCWSENKNVNNYYRESSRTSF